MTKPLISIIIPTLNEASTLPSTLKTVQTAPLVEVIVVDGGSSDQTVAVAESLQARVLVTMGGRACQMNAGAAVAQGDILLFLHADTRLPPDFNQLVWQTLNQPDVVAGAFDLAIDHPAWGLRWVEWAVKIRSRLGQMPYGDQAIFLRADQFAAVGQFLEMPIMEDFELIRRLQRRGRIAIAPAPVITSGRRWQRLSIWRTTLINQVMVIGYAMGVDPNRLAHWYRHWGSAKSSKH